METNVKPEASPSDDNLSNQNAVFIAGLARKIKTETTASTDEYETDGKRSIKVETNVSDINLQIENDCFSKNLEMDSKITIKEEPVVLDAELPNVEYLDCMSLATKIECDTITGNDFQTDSKMESGMQDFVSNTASQNDKWFTVDLKMKINKDICSDRDVETIIKREIDFHSKAASVADISHASENKESDLVKIEAAEDLSLSESPRLTRDSVHHYESSHTFSDASDLKSARRKNVNKEQRPNKSELKTDSLVLTVSKKGYICDICEKCFTTKSNLNKHMFVHTGATPYKCEHCKKGFTQKSGLKKHELLHSGTKPYKCEDCDKCFTQKSHLITHKLIHSGPTKPYKCEHCEKCFTRNSHLKTHNLIHSGTKPYKCEHCEKCFTQKSHLKTHKLLHAFTKPSNVNSVKNI